MFNTADFRTVNPERSHALATLECMTLRNKDHLEKDTCSLTTYSQCGSPQSYCLPAVIDGGLSMKEYFFVVQSKTRIYDWFPRGGDSWHCTKNISLDEAEFL